MNSVDLNHSLKAPAFNSTLDLSSENLVSECAFSNSQRVPLYVTGDFLVAFGGSDGKCRDAVYAMRLSNSETETQ